MVDQAGTACCSKGGQKEPAEVKEMAEQIGTLESMEPVAIKDMEE